MRKDFEKKTKVRKPGDYIVRWHFAFTLAEVLITLAVIGIVAVLTLPTLIQSYQERVKVTQLKKTYAVLQQAFQMAISEHGTLEKWNLGNTRQGTDSEGNVIISDLPAAKIIAYISPYLKKSDGSIVHTKKTSLDGRVFEVTPTVNKNDTADATTLLLADGTLLASGWQKEACDDVIGGKAIGCGDFWIYLPYSEQKLGVTFFNFWVTRDGLLPRGFNGDTSVSFDTYCDVKNKSGAASHLQGRGCAGWVLEKGNMDYLHCDDLAWDGKSKCSDK